MKWNLNCIQLTSSSFSAIFGGYMKSCGTIWISPTSFKYDFICPTRENELRSFAIMIMAMKSLWRRRGSCLARTVTLWCLVCTAAGQSGRRYSVTGRDFMDVKVWTYSRVPASRRTRKFGCAVKLSTKKALISAFDMKAFNEIEKDCIVSKNIYCMIKFDFKTLIISGLLFLDLNCTSLFWQFLMNSLNWFLIIFIEVFNRE